MEIPPVSKHTPLPTKHTGFFGFFFFPSSFSAPLAPSHCITTIRDSLALPHPTQSSEPNPSFSISFLSKISTFTPSLFSSSVRSANSSGYSTFAGSETKFRVSSTPSAIAASGA